MRLRPHHVLDIVTQYGKGHAFKPSAYGHAVHTVAARILADPDVSVEWIVGADAICDPCIHLGADGQCDDVLSQLDPPTSKQAYNDDLDTRLFDYLGLEPGVVLTVRELLQRVAAHVPGVEALCTHPGEDRDARLQGLRQGLEKLGV